MAQDLATIRRVGVLHRGSNFEVEIDATQPVTPKSQVVTGPDRLVIDFPNARPGRSLRPIAINAGEVKGIRMGLFESNPPTARVVFDLKSPQRYQIFPSGKTVIVKLLSGAGGTAAMPAPGIVALNSASNSTVPPPPQPASQPNPKLRLQVDFSNGRLHIKSDKATLAEILAEVQRRTGANVTIPAGAEHQEVVTDVGPGPAREVLSSLLSGSAYNVVLIGSSQDLSVITSIMLTPRDPGGENMPANYSRPPAIPDTAAETQPEPQPPLPPDNPPPDAPQPPDVIAPPQ
jgi:hypothetical protein